MNAKNRSPRHARVRSIFRTSFSSRQRVFAYTQKNTILLCYSIHTGLIIISLFLSKILPARPPSGFINESIIDPLWLNGLVKWDAHWYTFIAEHGYDSQSIVFFPTLILSIKALSYFGIGYALAGLLLCNIFTYLTFHMMYLTFGLDFPERVVRRALLAYAVMPTSFFLNSIYTESLFLFFTLACVYCSRKNQWLLAGLSGAAAALTRNLGVLLFFYLAHEIVRLKRIDHQTPIQLVSLSLPPFALLSYMLYNHKLTGNPLAFLHSQQGWGRYFDSPYNSVMNNMPLLFNGNPYIQPGATLDTFMVILTAFGLTVLTLSLRMRAPSPYLLIGWLWFLTPLASTSDWLPLYSASRFVLVIFPLYLFFGQLHSNIYYSLIVIGAVALSICAALFINWHWIG